ncbi:uncharacterized protein CXQ87_001451 [Candidozyma duobushaemuli]|uniref:Uncharacterized protein n=2 Tax=Candidozyma TaxID=3303203 RepID=A0ABX8I785_9ASCO|nr:uncharacterized protein CXQ87_001451 [[Candida] duobushaemulonis]PVH18520.1 hypothetical protein CXQ87_001451 [[Candida] duobushaemulonis]QWU87043.1 hypothetical protein CA3LBN_001261 [[Candida] haemuloni]
MRSYTVERVPPPSRPYFGRFLFFSFIGTLVLFNVVLLSYLVEVKSNASMSTASITHKGPNHTDPKLVKCLEEYTRKLDLSKCGVNEDVQLFETLESIHETYSEALKIVPLKWYHAQSGLESPSNCQKFILPELDDFTELVKTVIREFSSAQHAVDNLEFIEASKKPDSFHSVRSVVAAKCKIWGMVSHTNDLVKRFETSVRMNDIEIATSTLWQILEASTFTRFTALLGKPNLEV